MTDLEIIKRCAEKIGCHTKIDGDTVWAWTHPSKSQEIYNPLIKDAQCMALVKKFHLKISRGLPPLDEWHVETYNTNHAYNKDLNRAVCECVARMP